MLAPIARRAALTASKRITVARTFTSTVVSRSDDHHHGPPIIQGPGAKPGTVPTDMEQATGIERFEILSKLEGQDPFSNAPLEVPHFGTLKNPVMVYSLETSRLVGCTGYPVDSHDPQWIKVTHQIPRRCEECGCAYKVDFQGDPHKLHEPAGSTIHTFAGEAPRLKWNWGDAPDHRGKVKTAKRGVEDPADRYDGC